MIGRVLSDEFFENRDWPVASAVAILMLMLLVMSDRVVPASREARARGREMRSRGLFVRAMLVLGLVFLYVPILSMIVFSFNNSRLVTVWDAAHSPTLKWYVALVHNEQILGAAWLSVRIALISASASVVLGTLAGMALARFGPFRGRLLLAGMTTAPIVMPEVITGLSLLLLFVAMQQLIGWPKGVGATTIALAHITFCMAYVTVVVQSRLTGFDSVARGGGHGPRRAPAAGVHARHAAADPAGDRLGLAAGIHAVMG